MQSAIVLGGGMIGVSAALHLRQRGWTVTLVDRREPGRETSYGNAGMIQAEAVRPYPMPRDLASLLKIATGRTNDVRYSLSSLHLHIEPLLRYWWHSAPKRHREAIDAWARLIAYATAEHDILIREAHADNLIRRAGYRALYRDAAALDLSIKAAEEDQHEFGVNFRVLSGSELAKAEPVLRDDLPGAIHWLDTWTVSDPGALVTAYAELFERLGGRIVLGDAQSLQQTAAGWSVDTDQGRIDAATAVVTLGPWSPDLLYKFGYRIPLVRKRGYHMHYSGGASLDLPLIDKAGGYAMGPDGQGHPHHHGRGAHEPRRACNAGAARQRRSLRAGADRPRQTRRARSVVRHPPLHARHAAGARPRPASPRPLDEFRPRPPGLYAWPCDRAPARRDDERRDAGNRSDAVPAGAVLAAGVAARRASAAEMRSSGPDAG
ncbi:NAD(P)/FAD-dependent oxidoreductase [Bradyrhizobium diazoefficiens]